MFRKKLLILEDDQQYANSLKNAFEGIYEVDLASDENEFEQKFIPFLYDLLILDIRIGEEDKGLEILKKVKSNYPGQAVVVLTQHGGKEYFTAAAEWGIHLFLEKQDYSPKILLKLINSVLAFVEAENKLRSLEKKIEEISPLDIVGISPAIRKIKDDIKIAALEGDITVLITGETGVGKELVARNIHKIGKRKEKNFVAVNISAIPKELLYSELFGHEKGAFTDAKDYRKGYLEEANGGILFLDEIGDLDFEGQIKLLRVIEEKKFKKLGSNRDYEVDVQFIAATNQNLEELVRKEKFRSDLLYRLRQFEIQIPPLRERKEDIPLLCQHFLKLFNKKGKGIVESISPEAISLFLQYPWHGNVRELKIVLENGFIRAEWQNSKVINKSHLPGYLFQQEAPEPALIEKWDYEYLLAKAELQMIKEAMTNFGTKKKIKLASILQYPSRFTFMRRINRIFNRFPELRKLYPEVWGLFEKEK